MRHSFLAHQNAFFLKHQLIQILSTNRQVPMVTPFAKAISASLATRTILQERHSRIRARRETMKDTRKATVLMLRYENLQLKNVRNFLSSGGPESSSQTALILLVVF